ncbi:MAG: cyanophycinase [Myxococcota bacterium]
MTTRSLISVATIIAPAVAALSSSGCDDPASGRDALGLTVEAPADHDPSDEPRANPQDPADPKPSAPGKLKHWITGNEADADVVPTGPGLVLMGGGPDVDEAFQWWGNYIAGGDVVVIRTSGSDGYNDYLYDFGNADSVETLKISSRKLANDPYVAWTLRHAEAIFMTGGDQADYLDRWMGTQTEAAIEHAWSRGAIVGGTSAGLAVLGEFMFAADYGTVYSDEALTDPYDYTMTMEQGFLELPLMAGVVTDSHFYERDRMGRLVGFLARIHADGWANLATGLGIDERTAVLVGPDGVGTVAGQEYVYVVHADDPPQLCAPGLDLEYSGLDYYVLAAGDSLTLPDATVNGLTAWPLAASGGVTVPGNPY